MIKDGIKPEEVSSDMVSHYLFTAGVPTGLDHSHFRGVACFEFLICRGIFRMVRYLRLWPDFNKDEFVKHWIPLASATAIWRLTEMDGGKITMLAKRTIHHCPAAVGIPHYPGKLLLFCLDRTLFRGWRVGIQPYFTKADSKVAEVLLIVCVVLIAAARTFFPDLQRLH